MHSHSCEYPIAGARAEFDLDDHGGIAEPFMSWQGFVLLVVTAFSSYVL